MAQALLRDKPNAIYYFDSIIDKDTNAISNVSSGSIDVKVPPATSQGTVAIQVVDTNGTKTAAGTYNYLSVTPLLNPLPNYDVMTAGDEIGVLGTFL